jgi:thiol-disulfide isomerase/thioredoxin|tara:strand:- start:448 stop:1188 length:741 start_codon:yes stop_codon:yes gene_type:complete
MKKLIILACLISVLFGQLGGIKEIDPYAIYQMTDGKVITPEEAIRLTVVESYSAITSMDDDRSNKIVLIYKSYDELKGHFPEETINQLKKMDIAFGNKTPIQTIKKNWVGQKIPDYSFIDTYGIELNSGNLKGKVVIFNFWFTTCGGCLKEIPELNILVNKYSKNDDVVFIAPALNDIYTINNFLKDRTFLYKCTEGGDYINTLGLSGFPTHFVVNKNGIVNWVQMGSNKNVLIELENAIHLALIK